MLNCPSVDHQPIVSIAWCLGRRRIAGNCHGMSWAGTRRGV